MASRWPLVDDYIAAREQHYSNLAPQAAPFQPGEVYIKQERGMPATEMVAPGEHDHHERRMPATQMAPPGNHEQQERRLPLAQMTAPGVYVNGVIKLPIARMFGPEEYALYYPPERMTREEYALYYPAESAKRDEEERAAVEAAMIREKASETGSAELENVRDDVDTEMNGNEDEADSDSAEDEESEVESLEDLVKNIEVVEIEGELYISKERFIAIFRAFASLLQDMVEI